jgi:DNA-binding transcriptional MerR regulator
MNTELLLIGEVARQCGISDDTIRHYEKKGLVAPAERTPTGYRRYAAEVIPRIRMIRRAIRLGFSIDELSRIFRQRAAGKPPCRDVRDLAETKLQQLDEQIAELTALRSSLAATLERWEDRLDAAAEGQPAHLLESLNELEG